MRCPACKNVEMKPILTKQGVEIDYCESCKGIWLDKGELYYFTKDRITLYKEFKKATESQSPTDRKCPRTGFPMMEIKMFDGQLVLDYSPESGGIWFDANELEELTSRLGKRFSLSFDRGTTSQIKQKVARGAVKLFVLPDLVARSSMVIFLLYGILSLVLITASLFLGLPVSFALIIAAVVVLMQFLVGPFITDFTLKFFYRVNWVDAYNLPAYLREFIEETSQSNNMRFPRMGIISDGSPNAFTYGHHPNNARIVITQGLMDLLNEDEVKGVVAHEIGHAKHWDMLIMTAAQLVPLVLYYIYRTLTRMKSRRNDKSEGPRIAIAIGAYVLYIITEYAVLWLSRTREYYADRFAGNVTGNPSSLIKGLVKIGYGIAGKEPEKKDKESTKRSSSLEAVGALGIFDAKSSKVMAMTSVSSVTSAKKMGGEIDKDTLKASMKWDLWNPWAKYYELHSTHPLIANRINYLSNQSEAMGKEPYIKFDLRQPESYWDEFLVDIIVSYLPVLLMFAAGGVFAITRSMQLVGIGICLMGLASLYKVLFSYKSDIFPDMSISSLLSKVKVSAVRGVPCKLKGKIIGRGVPGLIWSEDFVMQDDTGIMFLDYKQPIPLWDFFFGLLRNQQYQDQDVELTGWYRRSPVPYIELKSIKTDSKESKCYTFAMKQFMAFAVIIIGVVVMFV